MDSLNEMAFGYIEKQTIFREFVFVKIKFETKKKKRELFEEKWEMNNLKWISYNVAIQFSFISLLFFIAFFFVVRETFALYKLTHS